MLVQETYPQNAALTALRQVTISTTHFQTKKGDFRLQGNYAVHTLEIDVYLLVCI